MNRGRDRQAVTAATDAVPAPRPSATVALARAGRAAPEFLLVRRHSDIAFGASYAFPGGALEEGDRDAHPHCAGIAAADADRLLGLPEHGLDYLSAAVRELFEETGVLLARDAAGRLPRPGEPGAELFGDERRALIGGKLGWRDFLVARGLRLACEELVYFAYWITPRVKTRRFSTRFFLARLPAGQVARHDGHELTDSCWRSAEDALAAARSGDLQLPPPTLATLRDFSAHPSLDALFEWASARQQAGVPRLLPAIVGDRGRERILMPDHDDYPADADGGET